MNKLFRLFPLLLLIIGICFFHATNVFAEAESDKDKKEIDISLSPTDTLFDVSNMKPGDWAPRTITVKNSGSIDFDYQMELQNNGEKKLFDELLLEIKVENMELYQGKLAEFKSLPVRKLISGHEENLDITIRFPEHLGNDFQGLGSSFTFTFTAEGKNSVTVQAMTKGMIDSGGSTLGFLSAASKNLFNLMLISSVIMAGLLALMILKYYRRMNPA